MRRKKHYLPIILILLFLIAAEAAVLLGGGLPEEGLWARLTNRDWRLILVNSSHPVPKNYESTLFQLANGTYVDERIYPDLQEMFDAARADGFDPAVSEGYRSHEDQVFMMEQYVETYLSQGYSREEAEAMAREYVAEPGTSEHELGIAVDIEGQGSSTAWEVYEWLASNSWRYGFILRYPDGKEEITGIEYEPWHYRYVGREAAAEIFQSGLTLEEYLEQK